jgi:hypothetical protein
VTEEIRHHSLLVPDDESGVMAARSETAKRSSVGGMPVGSFIMARLAEGGWRVTERRAGLTDIPMADFVSLRDAEEWMRWRQGIPEMNPYAKDRTYGGI